VFVVTVMIAPVRFAMPVVVDSITVLPPVGAMVSLDDASRKAHEGGDRTKHSYPLNCIHYQFP
jgi:hypothetical protein